MYRLTRDFLFAHILENFRRLTVYFLSSPVVGADIYAV